MMSASVPGGFGGRSVTGSPAGVRGVTGCGPDGIGVVLPRPPLRLPRLPTISSHVVAASTLDRQL